MTDRAAICCARCGYPRENHDGEFLLHPFEEQFPHASSNSAAKRCARCRIQLTSLHDEDSCNYAIEAGHGPWWPKPGTELEDVVPAWDAIPNRVPTTREKHAKWLADADATRNRVRAERVAESVYSRSPIRDKDSDRLLEWHEIGPLLREALIEQAQVYIEVTRYV